jgi:hypothetical protein
LHRGDSPAPLGNSASIAIHFLEAGEAPFGGRRKVIRARGHPSNFSHRAAIQESGAAKQINRICGT